MSKKPSAVTELRNLKTDYNRMRENDSDGAIVIPLTQARRTTHKLKRAMGLLKPLAKCEPELEYDDPDMQLYIGAAGEWMQCSQCFCEIKPNQTVSQDLVSGHAWCTGCWTV